MNICIPQLFTNLSFQLTLSGKEAMDNNILKKSICYRCAKVHSPFCACVKHTKDPLNRTTWQKPQITKSCTVDKRVWFIFTNCEHMKAWMKSLWIRRAVYIAFKHRYYVHVTKIRFYILYLLKLLLILNVFKNLFKSL